MCRRKNHKVWTEENLQYLIDNYAQMPTTTIAEMLGVRREYVCRTAKKLGLCKQSSNWKLTPEVKQRIISMYHTNSYATIAVKLRISKRAVKNFVDYCAVNIPNFQKRTKEENGKLISERRKELVKKERSHIIFGLAPSSNIRLGRSSHRRTYIRTCLRSGNNYEVDFASDEVFITNMDKRNRKLERRAARMGFDFYAPVELDEDGEILYDKIDIE